MTEADEVALYRRLRVQWERECPEHVDLFPKVARSFEPAIKALRGDLETAEAERDEARHELALLRLMLDERDRMLADHC